MKVILKVVGIILELVESVTVKLYNSWLKAKKKNVIEEQ